jgi:hypothetical protein
MLQAQQAVDATQDVLAKVRPDGSYTPDVKLPKQNDYKLMVAYAKILDPNSVVREGEITLLKKTSSAFQNLKNGMTGSQVADYINTIAGTQMFTAQERQNFVGLLKGSYTNRLASAKAIRDADAAALKELGASDTQINALLPFHPSLTGSAPAGTSAAQAQPGSVFTLPGSTNKLVKIGPGQYRTIKAAP